MTELVLKTLLSYLLGSLIGSLLVGRVRGGVDIRQLGSGNAGGTNALRTQGKSFALWVLLIDIGKGIIATRLIAPWPMQNVALFGAGAGAGMYREWLGVACGLAVIIGHVYPVWHGFRGGKGVATLVGVLFGLDAWLLLLVMLGWLVMAVSFGFIGLASMAAAASVPVFVELLGMQPRDPLFTFGVAIAVLILFTHRANIIRMREGREPRARRLWLFGRGRTS